ncbi:hypothetical protein CYMTET_47626 [Cymbomonas tetramitiformis]|uniref:DUF985 domain-containing protein n=1 Tax=Cymbomonas tetramitiformis TaxID=36881 RepID=A0AAE0EXJ1_9CHLO|nr:hypothetical protein CYMTET_47626 [Cymbomonas tetramitiformis]
MSATSTSSIALAVAAFSAGCMTCYYLWGSKKSSLTSQKKIISELNLIPHPEGGFFREIYRSGAEPMTSMGGTDLKGELMSTNRTPSERNVMTSIHWLLNDDSPNGWWCSNMSDHVHYYQAGVGMTYFIVHPDGRFETQRVGPNIEDGDVLQFVVKGGCLKACHKAPGDFVLIGEAVAPGFDFADFRWVTGEELANKVTPDVFEAVRIYVKPDLRRNFEDYYKANKNA